MSNTIIPRCDSLCSLCRISEAANKGSHMAPNFLIHKAFSFDGKGPRNREVVDKCYLNDMSQFSSYYGSEVSPERIKASLGHDMTDEEITDNRCTLMYDDIFCPTCEKKFSVIESEYARWYRGEKKKISPRVSYLFWLSVIWRMGIGRMGFFLDLDFEFRIRDILQKNLSLDLSEIEKGTNDLGNFHYVLWRAEGIRQGDSGIFGSRQEVQPYMAILNDMIVLMYKDKPHPDELTFLNTTFNVDDLNTWHGQESIIQKDRRWLFDVKDAIVESSYEYLDPSRERALLIVREKERSNNKEISEDAKAIVIKAARLADGPQEKGVVLRKFYRIFAGFFKERMAREKGEVYNPLDDEELFLTVKDYDNYYEDLANWSRHGKDISDFPYVDKAKEKLPAELFEEQEYDEEDKDYIQAFEKIFGKQYTGANVTPRKKNVQKRHAKVIRRRKNRGSKKS